MAWSDILGYASFTDVYAEWAKTCKDDAVFVEIGVFFGRSLAFMLEQLRNKPNVQVWAIDPWVDDWKPFPANVDDRMHGLAGWGGEFKNIAYAQGGPFASFCLNAVALIPAQDLDRVRVVRAPSVQAAKLFDPKSVDFCMIDGNHSYEFVSEDIKVWSEKMAPGGWLCGDDYWDEFPGVVRATKEAFGEDYEVNNRTFIKKF